MRLKSNPCKKLLPQQHLVDGGYVDAELLVDSQQQFGIELVGPASPDVSWQARAGQGYDVAQFQIDWETQSVTCPKGKTTQSWHEYQDGFNNPRIQARFSVKQCGDCPVQEY